LVITAIAPDRLMMPAILYNAQYPNSKIQSGIDRAGASVLQTRENFRPSGSPPFYQQIERAHAKFD
jgi:hypothetical protein